MASISPDSKSGIYYIRFRYNGRNVNRSLGTKVKQQAQAAKISSEERCNLLERGIVQLDAGVDPVKFILTNDKSVKSSQVKPATLTELFERYENEIPSTSKEQSTFNGERRHRKHLLRHIGHRTEPQFLTTADLQRYVDKRSKDKYRGKLIESGTIEKEITTFKLIWNWAVHSGYLVGKFPHKGLELPKKKAKPRFMTKGEIETKINRGGLTDEQIKLLWESLFLTVEEIDQMLTSAKKHASCNFVVPMLYFVAHTGARRSEILRSRIDDFNLDNGIVTIREKKKVHSQKLTYRHVQMSDELCEVMADWFAKHPGGQYTICENPSEIPLGLEEDQQGMSQDKAHYHFDKTLDLASWGFVRGFHVLRHSFASNLAATGIDQRVIDEWMGHQTDAMRKRYRHLFPKQKKSAIDLVFRRKR